MDDREAIRWGLGKLGLQFGAVVFFFGALPAFLPSVAMGVDV